MLCRLPCPRESSVFYVDGGLPVVEYPSGHGVHEQSMQGHRDTILAGKLRHGGHPVLRWCFGNVVTTSDSGGNIRFARDKSAEKIDAAYTGLNADDFVLA